MVPGLFFVMLLATCGIWLLSRETGSVPAQPIALLAPRTYTNEVARSFAYALEVGVPQLSLVWLSLLQEDLRPHGRALWSSYPVSTWTRALVWLLLTTVLAVGVIGAMALALRLVLPTRFLHGIVFVVPVVLFTSGLAFSLAELTWSPQYGALLSLVVSVSSLLLGALSHLQHPAWWMLFAASQYPQSQDLVQNRIGIAVAAVAVWAVAAGLMDLNRKWGREV